MTRKHPIVTVLEMLLAAISIVNGAVLLANQPESGLVWPMMDIICGALCIAVGAHWLMVKKRGVTASAWKIELGLMIPVFAASIVLLILPLAGKNYYQQMFWMLMSFALGGEAVPMKQLVENKWHEQKSEGKTGRFWEIVLAGESVLFIVWVVLIFTHWEELVHQALFWMLCIVAQIQYALRDKQLNAEEEAEERAEQEKNQYDPDLPHDRYE